MLLFDLLLELIFLKDAERLLLRIREVEVAEKNENHVVKATAEGEPVDAERHHQRADVKAVTLHDFSVERTEGGWKARVRSTEKSRSEEHTSELQSPMYLVCRLLLEKKKKNKK